MTSGPRIERIAFLTPEYVSEHGPTGGVGNYVAKMSAALAEQGVEAEVFVPSRQGTDLIEVDGIRVQRVPRGRSLILRGLARGLRPIAGSYGNSLVQLQSARHLASALQRRHRERPFDVVQSSNLDLTGAFVPYDESRRHVVRISTSRALFDAAYGMSHARASRWVEAIDARIMRRADLTYAPSALLAEHFRSRHGIDVKVIRPPAALGATPQLDLPFALPKRYFVHFGSLGRRKGTDLVARALVRAWRIDPSLQMVWIGHVDDQILAKYRELWGPLESNVTCLGVLPKELTYGVLCGAAASVLPSRVDNLPNTVIESLALGIPVIGSDGASIDELVENGVSGALVPIGDVVALEGAMLAAWQNRVPWLGTGFRAPSTLEEMRPETAVRRFLGTLGSTGVPSP